MKCIFENLEIKNFYLWYLNRIKKNMVFLLEVILNQVFAVLQELKIKDIYL